MQHHEHDLNTQPMKLVVLLIDDFLKYCIMVCVN